MSRRYAGPGKAARDGHDPAFADLAPSFDAFPGFARRDFEAFADRKQRKATYNAERLVVKRKLAALVTTIGPRLKTGGLETEGRTSLSHPYKHNNFRVAQMAGYFGRSKADKKTLKGFLGRELAEDADATFIGAVLWVQVDQTDVQWGLRLHQRAWWESQPLKDRIAKSREEAQKLCAVLQALPAWFEHGVASWPARHMCSKASPSVLADFWQRFTPGEHAWVVTRKWPMLKAVEAGRELEQVIGDDLVACVPLLKLIRWQG